MVLVICVAIFSGATLSHLGMPAFVQPTHLVAAAMLFGLQFLIWMSFRHARKGVHETRRTGLGRSNSIDELSVQ